MEPLRVCVRLDGASRPADAALMVEQNTLLFRHGAAEDEGLPRFDACLGEEASQQAVFEAAGEPIVSSLLDSVDAVLLCCGTGRQQPFIGAKDGLLTHVARALFERLHAQQLTHPQSSFEVCASLQRRTHATPPAATVAASLAIRRPWRVHGDVGHT